MDRRGSVCTETSFATESEATHAANQGLQVTPTAAVLQPQQDPPRRSGSRTSGGSRRSRKSSWRSQGSQSTARPAGPPPLEGADAERVDAIFHAFDAGKGVWGFEEARAARLALRGEDLTRGLYIGMCAQLAALPAEGWLHRHVEALYQHRPVFWDTDILSDYEKVQALRSGDGASEQGTAGPPPQPEQLPPEPQPPPPPPQQQQQQRDQSQHQLEQQQQAREQQRPVQQQQRPPSLPPPSEPRRSFSTQSAPPAPDPAAGADALFKAMKGMGTDEDAIWRELGRIRGQRDWDAVCSAFRTRHGGFHRGDLRAALTDELTSSELRRARGILAAAGVAWGPDPAPRPAAASAAPPPQQQVQPGGAPSAAAAPQPQPQQGRPAASPPAARQQSAATLRSQPYQSPFVAGGAPPARRWQQQQQQQQAAPPSWGGASAGPAAAAAQPQQVDSPSARAESAQRAPSSATDSRAAAPGRVFTCPAPQAPSEAEGEGGVFPCDLAELAEALEELAMSDVAEETIEQLQGAIAQHGEERRLLRVAEQRHGAVADTLCSALAYRIAEREERIAFEDRAQARRLQLREGQLRQQLQHVRSMAGALPGDSQALTAPLPPPATATAAAQQQRQPQQVAVTSPGLASPPRPLHFAACARSPRQRRTKLPVDLPALVQHITAAAAEDWSGATIEELQQALAAHRREHAELLRVIERHEEVGMALASAFEYRFAEGMHRIRYAEMQEEVSRSRQLAQLVAARDALDAVAAGRDLDPQEAPAHPAEHCAPASGAPRRAPDRALSPPRPPLRRQQQLQVLQQAGGPQAAPPSPALAPGTRVYVAAGGAGVSALGAATATVLSSDPAAGCCTLRLHRDGSALRVPLADCCPLSAVGRQRVVYTV